MRQRNLRQEQIKIRILSYLYHRQEGANAHSIQFHGISGHTQEAGRCKILLEELCDLECIDKVPMDHVTAGRVIYAITDKGRGTIQKLLDPLVLDFFGSTKEDLLFSDPQH